MASLLDMTVRFGADTAAYRRALRNAKSDTDNWAKNIKTTLQGLGSVFAGAFAIDSVMQLARETIQLAMTAEGVEQAFSRLNNAKLLDNLREATKGTVNDFLLMKAAVQSKNFQIPLDQMGKLLSFAQRRAIETGQSMDYLVDSIVIGIGRKSPLILDNLGISAIRLREEFKGLGIESVGVGDVAAAVGRIIDEEMKAAGDSTLTTNEKFEQQKVKLQNLQLTVGKSLLPTMNAMLGVTNDIGDSLSGIADNQALWELLASYMRFVTWVPRLAAKGVGAAASVAKNIFSDADEAIATATESMAEFDWQTGKLIFKQKESAQAAVDQRSEYQKLTDDIELMKTQFNAAWDVTQIAQYNKKLKELEDRLEAIKTALPRESLNIDKLNPRELDSSWRYSTNALNEKTARDWKVQVSPEVIWDTSKIQPITVITKKIKADMEDAGKELEAQWENINLIIQDAIGQLAVTIAKGLGTLVVTGDWKQFFRSILSVIASFMTQLGSALMAVGIGLETAKQSFKSMNGYAVMGAAAALLIAAGVLESVLDKGIDKPRQFAEGGIVKGSVFANIGEYAGANRNPEVVAPLSELQKYMNGGSGEVVVRGRLVGADLLISNERSSYQRSRVRGF